MGILDRDYSKENFNYNTMSYDHPKLTNHSNNSSISDDIKARQKYLLDESKNAPRYSKKDNYKLSDSLRYRYSTVNNNVMPSDINVSLHRPFISLRNIIIFSIFIGTIIVLKNIS